MAKWAFRDDTCQESINWQAGSFAAQRATMDEAMDEAANGGGEAGQQAAISAFERVLGAVSRARQELQRSGDTNILSSTRQLFRRRRNEGMQISLC